MVPLDEIADPKNDYNLNLPRYIDSTEPEDLHDIEGHLRGGIPERDLDALADYWRVLPWGLANPPSGEQRAVFDLASPHGLQDALSQPVAVLRDEDAATTRLAGAAGFRCFAEAKAFKRYVRLKCWEKPPVPEQAFTVPFMRRRVTGVRDANTRLP
jgi:hypothetical protein